MARPVQPLVPVAFSPFPMKSGELRLLVAVAVIGALALTLDRDAALAALSKVRLGPVLAGLLLVQVQVVLSAERWRFTAARLGQAIPRGHAIREYYVASLLNQILPGGMSGDAIRAVRNRRPDADTAEDRWQAPVRAVVLERMAGQAAFLLVTLLGLAVWPWLTLRTLPDGAVALTVAAGLLLAGVIGLVASLAWKGPETLRGLVRGFAPAMRAAWIARGAWAVQGGLSLVIAGSYIAVFVLTAAATGMPLPLPGVLTVVPLVLLTMLVPVSIAGWGVREAAAAALWPVVGMMPEAGVAASVLYGLVSLAGTLPGVLFLWRGHRDSAA